MSNPITIEEVKRLHLEDGDTLVLRVGMGLDADSIKYLTEQMREAFPDHRVAVLQGDMDLEVVGAPAGPAEIVLHHTSTLDGKVIAKEITRHQLRAVQRR